jgi:outer membrane immunogenic protein
MRKFLFILFYIAFISSAFADGNGMKGFYGQISSGYEEDLLQSLNVTTTTNGSTSTATGRDERIRGVPLVLGFGYFFDAYKNFKVGVGVDYSALTQSQVMVPTNKNGAPNTFYIQNRTSIFLMPAWQIDESKLLYLKGGYSTQKVSEDRVSNSDASGYNISGWQNGYIVGAGYRQEIYKGFYGFVEANYMQYNNVDLYSSHTTYAGGHSYPSTTFQNPKGISYTTLAGIGYKF